MRVCHLGKFYPPASGGIESHLQTLVHAQVRLGAQVEVVCVNHQGQSGADLTWNVFSPTRSTEEQDGPVKVIRLGRLASVARFDICPGLPGLFRRLARSGFDLLHLHVPNPTMLLALAMARPRLPWIISYHSDVVRQKFLAKLLRPFENVVFHRASAVLASSPLYRAGSAFLQGQGDKVSVVPYGIGLEPFRHPSEETVKAANDLRRELGQPLWLAVGRLVYYKGLELALKALAQVPGRLLIVGKGPLEKKLRELSRELQVADRVVWRDWLSIRELAAAYHAATALWFPSNARSEAFGIVQIEAMACGCPIINTNLAGSGVPWVSVHEATGLTVPVNDSGALAQAARRLLDEPGLREALGQRARERAEREFGDDLMARRSLAIYNEVLDRTHPRLGVSRPSA